MDSLAPQPDRRAQRLLRYIRILFACLSVLVCLCLLMLWVRSMYTRDLASLSRATLFASTQGRMVFYTMPNGPGPWSLDDVPHYAAVRTKNLLQPVAWDTVPAGPYITTPYWLWVLLTGATAVVLWRPRHFSLRSLFVVIAILSLLLGLVVALSRR